MGQIFTADSFVGGGFTGSLSGTAATATLATTASRVDVTNIGSTAGTYSVLLADEASGTQRVYANTLLEYSPSTNTLSVSNLEGNASSANNATSASYARTASYAPAYLPLTGGTVSGNLTVIGTASFAYSTASVVQVGASTITLNTNNPATRFGGITVIDSGSFGNSSTGSLFWDSLNNKWIYSNPSGSTYDGGMLISGPRNTSGIGNEVGTLDNYITKGQGGDHITSSMIYEDNSGNVGIGETVPTAKLHVADTNKLFDSYGNINVFTTNTAAADIGGSIALGGTNSVGGTTPYVFGKIQGIKEGSASTWNGALLLGTTNTNSSISEKMRITSAGNVGINTATPETKLHIEDVTKTLTGNVAGVAQGTLSLVSTDAQAADVGASLVFGGNYINASQTKIAYAGITGRKSNASSVNADGYLSFLTWRSTGLTEAMRITAAGSVGINTTNPTLGTLQVAGNVYANSYTGSLFGTASFATTASFALNAATASIAFSTPNAFTLGSSPAVGYVQYTNNNLTLTGTSIYYTGGNLAINKTTPNAKLDISGSTLMSGSLRGQVNALSIASNTASIDLASNNFFTISLVNGATTHISASNILPGQTVNVRVTQGSLGTGKLQFNSAIKSGSLYTGSAVANAVDIMTFISFDSSTLYMSAVTNLK